jgi:hypothetical protein
MVHRRLIVCVDCAANLAEDRWRLLRDIYECEVVQTSEQALQTVANRYTDAIVTVCPVSAAEVVMQLKTLRRETPVVMLGSGLTKCMPDAVEVAVETVPDITALLDLLSERFASLGTSPIIPQRHQIGPICWPFSVLADRSGKVVGLQGKTVMLGAGGMYGRMTGALQLGETVLVEFPNVPENPPFRAQVRSRVRDIYGFTFQSGIAAPSRS